MFHCFFAHCSRAAAKQGQVKHLVINLLVDKGELTTVANFEKATIPA